MTLRRIRPQAAMEAILWVALLVFIGSRMWPQIAAAFGVQSAGARAPDFQLTTLDGQQVSLASLRGKVVLVNFWATWCPPCRIEMPGFQRVYEAKRHAGFTIVGVSTDAIGSRVVADFVRERGITYPIAMATGAVIQEFGGARTLPTSFLIDREGRIRNEVKGIFTSVALEQAVDRLLAESPSTPQGKP
ncbi:MAG TPA: TlpA disulfide reductase family protein [Gemmatimonadaceae bacterium]|nr:TlpA disulfide reductase family protein [Gemmatimonadaceae bacterium]